MIEKSPTVSKLTMIACITSVLEGFCQCIKNNDFKAVLITSVPLLAIFINYLIIQGQIFYNHYNKIKTFKSWIKDLELEILDKNTSKTRKSAAREEIRGYQNEIKDAERHYSKMIPQTAS